MTLWMAFWKWLTIAALVLYAGLSLAVAVGGVFDIRNMFRTLREQHKEPGD